MSRLELTKQVNLECAIKSKPIKKLKKILNKCDVERLRDYYNVITKKENEDNKKSLIDKIYNELTNENIIHNFLSNLKENEYQQLVKIIENNGEYQDNYIKIEDYGYLKYFGILYTFNYQDNLHIIIPDEIMDVIKNMDVNAYHQKTIENSKLVNLAYSMLNLYGVVPLDIYLDACRKYYDYKNAQEINLDCLFIPERTISVKAIHNENNVYIVKDDAFDEYDGYIIYKTIIGLEDDLYEFNFKEMPLEELLKYQNLFYYEENEEIVKFIEYLRNYNLNDEDIDLFIGSLVLSFRRNYNEGILILNDISEEFGIELNQDNLDEIMSYINNIINNIPNWGNKGWTNKEIILGKCYE